MGQVFALAVNLEQVTCGECGGVYALTERFVGQKRDHGESWNCPYCKVEWGYTGKGKLQTAQRELENEKTRHRDTLARLNEAAAERDRLKEARARVQRGVCPCCNRSFVHLARHMAAKHPEKK